MDALRVYLSSRNAENFRKAAMERFGYAKGSLSKAAETAIARWTEQESAIKSEMLALVGKAALNADISAMFVFGSYARGEAGYGDVDVAILLKNDNVSSPVLLADYGDEKGVLDVSIMNRLPLSMQARIFGEGKVVYCREKSELYAYYFKVLAMWEDFRPRFERILAARMA